MRKRNISFIADKLLWFILLMLPVLFALVFTCASMNNYTFALDNEYFLSSVDGYNYSTYYNCCNVNDFEVVRFTLNNFQVDYDDYDEGTFYYGFVQVGYTFPTDDFSNRTRLDLECNFFLSDDLSNKSIQVSFPSGFFVPLNVEYNDFDYIIDDENSCAYVSGTFFFSHNYNNFYAVGFLDSWYNNFKYYNYVSTSNDSIFNTYFNNLNYSLDSWFTFGERDIVYNAFNSIFGSQSHILPIFVEGSFIPKYLTYMAWIYVLHLAFDFLVFIPRLAHKWMGGVYKDEDS